MSGRAIIEKDTVPQDSICSAFITWVCNECNASAGNTHCPAKNALEKAYAYGLL